MSILEKVGLISLGYLLNNLINKPKPPQTADKPESNATHTENPRKFDCKRGEVYCATLDPVIGREQGKTRPVLIISNNAGNTHSDIVTCALIKSGNLPVLPTHVKAYIRCDSIIMAEQIRTLDKSRFTDYLTTLGDDKLQEVNRAIKVSLGL